MDDLDDAMFEGTAAVAEPEVVAPQPEPPQEAPEVVQEPVPEPEPQQHDEGRFVPIAAMLDERDKAKEAKRERDEYKRQLDEYQRSQQQPQEAPDPYDDPEGFRAYAGQQVQQALQAQRLDISWAMAAKEHGVDTVSKARDWAVERGRKDPQFRVQLEQAMAGEPLPMEWIVAQHKRDAMLSDIGSDPVAYARRIAEREGWLTAPTPAPANLAPAVPQPASPPARVPRSLATQGSGPNSVAPVANGPLVGLED